MRVIYSSCHAPLNAIFFNSTPKTHDNTAHKSTIELIRINILTEWKKSQRSHRTTDHVVSVAWGTFGHIL